MRVGDFQTARTGKNPQPPDVHRRPPNLRIGVHDFSGHPFQVELSRALASRGHTVTHWHCPDFLTGKGNLRPSSEGPFDLRIVPVRLGKQFRKYSPAVRFAQEWRYGRLLSKNVAAFQPEVVLSSNTPLLAQRELQRMCRRYSIPVIFWQQDIYSEGIRRATRRRHRILGPAAARLFEDIERSIAASSAAVVPITESFVPTLRRWGVPERRIKVIENWAPLAELPELDRDNHWAQRHDLVGRTTAVYSGTLGLKHNPGLLLALAREMRSDPSSRLVVISEGPGAEWLRGRAEDERLTNLIQMPFQDFADVPFVHASADLLIVILEADAQMFSVPSKVLTYHCAGRPILGAIPASNLAAQIIKRAGSGEIVGPEDTTGFVKKARAMIADGDARSRWSRHARRYAEETFDIERITDRFEELLANVSVVDTG
jgi:colanic acid biosynthesis glycosyl transferase WcaI